MYKDKSNNIYVYLSNDPYYNKENTALYRLSPDLSLDKADHVEKEDLLPLFYTKFPYPKKNLGYVEQNELSYLDSDVENPIIADYSTEFFVTYFFKNLSGFLCFNLDEGKCPDPDRKVKYLIKLKHKNKSLQLQSKGNDDMASISFYYLNDPNKDDRVFVCDKRDMWVINSK